MTKETLRAYYNDLKEYINDEPLDMLEDFNDGEIAVVCLTIASALNKKKVATANLFTRSHKRMRVKVVNEEHGFLTLSNEECTAVSKTCYYPYFVDDEEHELAGLKNLASMMNEAYFSLSH